MSKLFVVWCVLMTNVFRFEAKEAVITALLLTIVVGVYAVIEYEVKSR